LPVVLCLDRAGLVGEDGPTHHGCYDIAYMRCIPNLIVSAPMNERELRNLMYTAQLETTTLPIVIRYPRGEGVNADLQKDTMATKYPFEEIKIGKGRKLKDGEGVAILSFGHPGNFAAQAIRDVKAEGINPAHYDMRFAKPLDEEMLHEVFSKFNKIITIEDGTVVGGFGTAILEFMNEHGYKADVNIMGIPDRLVEHGTPKELYNEIGLDANAIAANLRAMTGVKVMVK
jgi:1-deoxy-D-xylulose-5-phosphate synthase